MQQPPDGREQKQPRCKLDWQWMRSQGHKPSGDAALRHADKTGADVGLVEPSSALQSSSFLSMPSRPGNGG